MFISMGEYCILTISPDTKYIIPAELCGYLPYSEQDKLDIIENPTLQRREWHVCKHNFVHFCWNWVYIEDEDGEKSPFRLNDTQKRYRSNETDRDIVLKARKLGFSTYAVIEGFHLLIFNELKKAQVICHVQTSTDYLYRKLKYAYKNLPDFLRPTTEAFSQKIIIFDEDPFGNYLGSEYQVATAGSEEFGRGGDVDFLHLSEYAFYNNPTRIKRGAMQAMRRGKNAHPKISIESTANGFNDLNTIWENCVKTGELKDGVNPRNQFVGHFHGWLGDKTCTARPWPRMMEDLSEKWKEYYERHKCTPEQIAFHQNKLEELGEDGVHQEFPATEMEAFISSSRSVFDVDLLSKATDHLEARKAQLGREFIKDSRYDGGLIMYHLPVEGRRYTMGADNSKGVKDGDYSCAIVLDNETGEEVAELHGRWTPEEFANKLNELGREYNNALLCVERMAFGELIIYILRMVHRYPRLFRDWSYDATTGAQKREIGWRPSVKTKPMVIGLLQDTLRNGDIIVNSIKTLHECRTYVHLTDTKMGAEEGTDEAGEKRRDDRVIALALATYVMIKHPWRMPDAAKPFTGTYRDWFFRQGAEQLKEKRDKARNSDFYDEEFADYEMAGA